ncbi:MAG: SDR family oxidoreductase [Defluviitaleaceae bacterium]|nr:SDR family oxidoreductase [Defluviitaleaceae bacterium]MCL2836972.1 SDR family oxidoreductase [Defluviitaleaceae bacterium]
MTKYAMAAPLATDGACAMAAPLVTDGACAMVTGGNRHIGQGIAIVLAEHGYDIAITYATGADGAVETRRRVEALGKRCFIFEAHLEEADGPDKAVKQARESLGRIDVMVCNAGRDMRNSVLTSTAETYDFLYANNLRNYFLCAGAAARHMVNDGTAGSIIMITSSRAVCAHPDDFYYGALKAAVERACKSMALDLSAYNIRVNCVAPGAVWKPDKDGNLPDTPFLRESVPMRRTGTVRDVGEAVAFLAGDKSSYITGTTLLVDGGLSLPALLEQPNAVPWKYEGWTAKQYEKMKEMTD